MADRRVKYTYDDGPFSDVGITGKQTSWRKNDSAFVPEADAALLISSGKFVDGTDFGSNDVHKQEHREIGGVPRQVAVCGVPFVIPAGDGSTTGLQFTGSDRNYPPPVYKNSRTITAQLTPTERANIFAAALANSESASGLAVAVIPVSSDVEFDVTEATPFLEQLVNDGLLTPARAVELLQ